MSSCWLYSWHYLASALNILVCWQINISSAKIHVIIFTDDSTPSNSTTISPNDTTCEYYSTVEAPDSIICENYWLYQKKSLQDFKYSKQIFLKHLSHTKLLTNLNLRSNTLNNHLITSVSSYTKDVKPFFFAYIRYILIFQTMFNFMNSFQLITSYRIKSTRLKCHNIFSINKRHFEIIFQSVDHKGFFHKSAKEVFLN